MILKKEEKSNLSISSTGSTGVDDVNHVTSKPSSALPRDIR